MLGKCSTAEPNPHPTNVFLNDSIVTDSWGYQKAVLVNKDMKIKHLLPGGFTQKTKQLY